MQPFRIIGVSAGSEQESAITLLAASVQDAKAQAHALGLNVNRAEPCELLTPRRSRGRRHVQPASGRGLVRFIVGFSALLLMLPGALTFCFLALAFAVAILRALDSNQNVEEVATQMVTTSVLLPLSIVTMLGGALLFVLLYIEDHAYDIRRVVNDGL